VTKKTGGDGEFTRVHNFGNETEGWERKLSGVKCSSQRKGRYCRRRRNL